MIDYFIQNLWLFWTIVTFVCLIMELTSGDFYVTCFAIGALVAVLASVIPVPFWLQVLVWAAFSLLSIWLIRPRLLKLLHRGAHERKSNADALIGRIGCVVEPIAPEGYGYVKVDGDEWKARTRDFASVGKGEWVRIVARDSIIVTVEKVDK